jgi:hypothetical protein
MSGRSFPAVAAFVLVSMVSAPARADDVAPVASTVEAELVLELVRADKLRAALDLAEPGRDELSKTGNDGRSRRLGLAWAIVRAACLSLDRKDDERSVKSSIALAQERALPEDLGIIRELGAASERAAPYARLVARAATAKIDAGTDRHALTMFLKGDDEDARRRAIAAIGERLSRIRAKVDSGGDLDFLEQAELADPALIDALVDELAYRQAVTDVLAHDLAANATPSPLHALALIEAPAIPALEAGKRRGAQGADEAIAAILEASRERIRHHPSSTWSSARGALPQVCPDAVPCPACKKPLPVAARFCPGCGAGAPGVACVRCGQRSVTEICPRCGGVVSAKASPRTCVTCNEPIGAGDRFCRRCGTSIGAIVPPK